MGLPQLPERSWSMVDWVVAGGLAAVSQYAVWAGASGEAARGPRLAISVLFVFMTVPLAWRRRAPLAVLIIVTGSAVACSAVFYDLAAGRRPDPFLFFLIAIYSVAAHEGRGRAVMGAVVAAAAVLVNDLSVLRAAMVPDDVYAWLLYALAWLAGRLLRRRKGALTVLASRTAQLEREQDEATRVAVAEEHSRIARELHDVIAHSLAMITIQAAAERRVLDPTMARTREVLGDIEHAARQALTELRHLLGVLRHGDEVPPLEPSAGVDRVPDLVAELRHAGLTVDLHIDGDPVCLPPGVDLTAYRIVQEGLTNVVKHAATPRALVGVTYGAHYIDLEVVDGGRGPGSGGTGGHGLIGMRERVALFGGTFEAASVPGGGFRLHARLPTGTATR
jgi:signal transduction histidine kinase